MDDSFISVTSQKRVLQKKHMPLISFQSAIAASSLRQGEKHMQELHTHKVAILKFIIASCYAQQKIGMQWVHGGT